jgi:hypothetical protein
MKIQSTTSSYDRHVKSSNPFSRETTAIGCDIFVTVNITPASSDFLAFEASGIESFSGVINAAASELAAKFNAAVKGAEAEGLRACHPYHGINWAHFVAEKVEAHFRAYYNTQLLHVVAMQNQQPTHAGGFGSADIHPNAKAIQQQQATMAGCRIPRHPLNS